MTLAVFVCGSGDFHPYECGGPGKCIHCDGTRTERHNPDECWLCHDGPPPNACQCKGSGVIDTGEPSDSDASSTIHRQCLDYGDKP